MALSLNYRCLCVCVCVCFHSLVCALIERGAVYFLNKLEHTDYSGWGSSSSLIC